MIIAPPRLATEGDAAALIPLFCSGQEGIGLKPHVCSPERLPDLLVWMKKKCTSGLVWTINDGPTPIGMLVLDGIAVITVLYVVVAQHLRGQKIGSTLVNHIQSLGFSSLRAEARNEYSERMLIGCGFHHGGEFHCGHPIVVWERAA